MKLFTKKNSVNWTIFVIGFIGLYSYLNLASWRDKAVINHDPISYYAYLPAAFIYHDLSLEYCNNGHCAPEVVVWPHHLPNGKLVIKMSMGLSVFYAPLFFIAHTLAPLLHYNPSGYSIIYHFCIGLTSLLYLLLGLIILQKILRNYFDDTVITISFLIICIATNMLSYFTFETASAHLVNFFLVNLFIWLTIDWHKNPDFKKTFFLGIVLGSLILIRPTNIMVSLLFIFYNIYDIASFKIKVALLVRKSYLLWIIPVCGFLFFLPQMLYWKMQTGHYFFNSYVGEKFNFDNPHILYGLFSYRKGWLLYSPIMILFFIGLPLLYKNLKEWILPISLFFIVITYIIFSWWCWWYGGSYGQRPYIDFYGLFAIPIALVVQKVNQLSSTIKKIFYTVCFLLLALNCTQLYQYKRGVIHYDSMTKKKYWAVFLKFGKTTSGSDSLLQPPDCKKAVAGIEEY